MGAPGTELRDQPVFRVGMEKLGWVDGRNLSTVSLWARGDVERLPSLVTELLSQKVDLIIASSTAAAIEAKKLTQTIPIVLVAYDRDPVAAGVVASLSRPGANVTGIFSRQIDLTGKRLELLKETIPGASRIAMLYDPARAPAVRDLEAAAKKLGLRLQAIALKDPQQIDRGIKLAKTSNDAALVLFSPMLFAHRDRIASAAIEAKMPTMCQEREFVASGALISYAPDRDDIQARVVYYVDRLLRGAKPADLPVEEASKFKLTLNLKTARALGLHVPEPILLRADELIR